MSKGVNVWSLAGVFRKRIGYLRSCQKQAYIQVQVYNKSGISVENREKESWKRKICRVDKDQKLRKRFEESNTADISAKRLSVWGALWEVLAELYNYFNGFDRLTQVTLEEYGFGGLEQWCLRKKKENSSFTGKRPWLKVKRQMMETCSVADSELNALGVQGGYWKSIR